MNWTKHLGDSGEVQAADYLMKQGLEVIERKYGVSLGEVDLICKDKATYVFVEVKLRQRAQEISALDAITPAKQKRIVRAALAYMKRKGLVDEEMRFDVVTIEEGKIEWILAAFDVPPAYTY